MVAVLTVYSCNIDLVGILGTPKMGIIPAVYKDKINCKNVFAPVNIIRRNKGQCDVRV